MSQCLRRIEAVPDQYLLFNQTLLALEVGVNATNTTNATVVEGLEVIDKEQTNFVGFSHYVTLGASQPLPFQGADFAVYNTTTTEVLVAETLFGIQHLYTHGGHLFRNKYEFFQILLRVVEYPNSYITNEIGRASCRERV